MLIPCSHGPLHGCAVLGRQWDRSCSSSMALLALNHSAFQQRVLAPSNAKAQITHCQIRSCRSDTHKIEQEFNGISRGGSSPRLDPAQARARRTSPHQSQPMAGLSCPALPGAPGPATPKHLQHPKTAPRWGRLDDVLLFQCLGRVSAFHPTIPWCIEGGLDSPFSTN